jgi:hypothetical protein
VCELRDSWQLHQPMSIEVVPDRRDPAAREGLCVGDPNLMDRSLRQVVRQGDATRWG